MKKTLNNLLKYPPKKSIICRQCDGDGIINRRGMIMSDPCPRCEEGKEQVIDYPKWEKQIINTMQESSKPSAHSLSSMQKFQGNTK